MTAEALKGILRADLREAMRARDTLRISALRTLIAAIDNAEAIAAPATDGAPNTRAVSEHIAVTGHGPSEAPRRVLSAPELAAILQTEADSMAAAAAELRGRGQDARGEECAAKAAIALSYLDRASSL